jgi:DNA-binding CsgD family transcriptional regulator
VAALRECGDIVTGWEMGNPTLTPWRSTLALALQAGGETESARELAERQLADARRIGAPRALGISLRVAGIVTGRRVGEGLMREAVAVLEETEARLELAHSLAALGCALRDRRAGDAEARALLERALDLAHRCDASALRNRVHRDLVALGARPRRYAMTGREALTAAEARVAGLAANGMVNRDIAQALFVTEKTVEKHLTNAYAKLGIASRDALTDALAA